MEETVPPPLPLERVHLRFVLQRVSWAEVTADGIPRGTMEQGLVVLLGVGERFEPVARKAVELPELIEKTIEKILNLRIFSDEHGKMNRSLRDVGGKIYVVSQFTLFADCSRGTRPGFSRAAPTHQAVDLYDRFVRGFEQALGGGRVLTGIFGSHMAVSLCNDGPVTILLNADCGGFS